MTPHTLAKKLFFALADVVEVSMSDARAVELAEKIVEVARKMMEEG